MSFDAIHKNKILAKVSEFTELNSLVYTFMVLLGIVCSCASSDKVRKPGMKIFSPALFGYS